MPIEPATTIGGPTGLNASYPAPSDGLLQGDDHLRLLKAVLIYCFPNIQGQTTVSHTQLNDLAAGLLKAATGSAGAPSLTFGGDTASGLYKLRTGRVGVSGTLRGAVGITGQIVVFPALPPANAGVLVCDGAQYKGVDYPELGAYLGLDGNGNFTVPDYRDHYLRGHGGAWAPGTALADQVGGHAHTASAVIDAAGAHDHGVFLNDPGHTHSVPSGGLGILNYQTGQGANNPGASQTTGTSPTGITIHNGAGSTNRTAGVAAHTHSVTVTVASSPAGETRPKSKIAVFCIVT